MKIMVSLILTMLMVQSFEIKAQIIDKNYSIMLQDLLEHNVPEISVKEFSESKLKSLILDSRSKKEFAVSKIKNAIWVGFSPSNLSMITSLPKNTPIVIYCSVGYRSEKVNEKLIENGFTNVKNLYGGIFEWVNEENLIVDQKNNKTDKIHPFNNDWGKWLTKGIKSYK